MARLNRAAIPDGDSDMELYVDHSHPQAQSSSSPPNSSDKENNTQAIEMPVSTRSKGKARASTASVQPDETTIPTSAATARSTTSQTAATSTSRRSKAPLEPQVQQGDDVDVPDTEGPDGGPSREIAMMYDPQQDHEERKQIRRTYRDLHRKVTDNKAEYLKKNNDALFDVFQTANSTFRKVKQTGDACLDSKLLLTAGDLAVKKAQLLTSGATHTGVDIEDYITNIIKYLTSAARSGDEMPSNDWSNIGKNVSSRSWRRPATTDFLLGPLGVVKRQRIVKERRKATRRRADEMVRPDKLDEKQIAKNENSTTKHVMEIAKILDDYLVKTNSEQQGVLYFKLVINPFSFSQTVENIFYTAFLVRDGRLAITEDESNGLPYLIPSLPPTAEEVKETNIVRKQIIMEMDKKTWREAIKVFNITEAIIPMRERETRAINASGWYS